MHRRQGGEGDGRLPQTGDEEQPGPRVRVEVSHRVTLVLVETLVQRVVRNGVYVKGELELVEGVDQRLYPFPRHGLCHRWSSSPSP